MRKTILCLILVAVLASCLLLQASAATPGISLTRTELSGGKYTVTVNFADIPANNGVEYAQILLTCRSSQHNITNNSLTMLVSGDLLVTKQFNTSADSLLVLIEPTKNTFAGIGSGSVFTFTVSQSSGEAADPGFDLSAILILKDGTEQEINQRVNATLPSTPTQPTTVSTNPTTASTTAPTTISTTAPTTISTTAPTTIATQPGDEDPCLKGHTFKNGFCVYCAEHDPDYDPCDGGHHFQNGFCIYCLEKDPDYDPCAVEHTFKNGYCIYCLELDPNWNPDVPTSEPTTAPTTAPTTQPTVNGGANENPANDITWILILVAVVMLGGIAAMVVVLVKKK